MATGDGQVQVTSEHGGTAKKKHENAWDNCGGYRLIFHKEAKA